MWIVEEQGYVLGRGLSPEQAQASMPQKQATRKWIANAAGEMVPSGVNLVDPDDFDTKRGLIYEAAKKQLAASYPMSHNGLKMDIEDLEYEDPDTYSPAEQKAALLGDKTLARRLRGTVKLTDEATNEVLDQKRMSLMRVPHLTERGTYIHAGNEITSINQSRLMPGAYTRLQANGELSTHFNCRPGTGKQFKVGLEPMTGQYRMRVGTANLHLYSLLKDLGVEDEDLEKRWGKELLDVNRAKYDKKVLPKAYERFVRPVDRVIGASHDQKVEAVNQAFNLMQINEGVARRHLPNLFDTRKSAAWHGAEVPEFKPDLSPDSAAGGWLALNAPLEKLAAFRDEELRRLAAFVAQATGAQINIQGKKGDIEAQILQAIGETPTTYNAAVMQAGLQAQKDSWKQASWGAPTTRLSFAEDGDNLEWIQWYEKYASGHRSESDERRIRTWAQAVEKTASRYKRNQTPALGNRLRSWAVNPDKLK